MPPSGAGFFLSAFGIYTLLLIGVEAALPDGEAGGCLPAVPPPCLPVCSLVSAARRYRLMPAVRSGCQLFLNETYPIAITLCFALFAWRYNARILIRCVLICYGLSLVVRAMTKRPDGGMRVPQ